MKSVNTISQLSKNTQFRRSISFSNNSHVGEFVDCILRESQLKNLAPFYSSQNWSACSNRLAGIIHHFSTNTYKSVMSGFHLLLLMKTLKKKIRNYNSTSFFIYISGNNGRVHSISLQRFWSSKASTLWWRLSRHAERRDRREMVAPLISRIRARVWSITTNCMKPTQKPMCTDDTIYFH